MKNTIENHQLTAHAAAQMRAEALHDAFVRLHAIAMPNAATRATLVWVGCVLALVMGAVS